MSDEGWGGGGSPVPHAELTEDGRAVMDVVRRLVVDHQDTPGWPDAFIRLVFGVSELVDAEGPLAEVRFAQSNREAVVELVSQWLQGGDHVDDRGLREALVGIAQAWQADSNTASAQDAFAPFLARGEAMRAELLHIEGEPCTAGEAAARLGITRQGVHKRRVEGRLLAFRQGRGFVYPCWQFTEDGTLAGLAAVLRELEGLEPIVKLQFFVGGQGPRGLDHLRAGAIDVALREARVFGRQAGR